MENLTLRERALKVLREAEGSDFPFVTTVLTADEHALIREALLSLSPETPFENGDGNNL